MIENELDNVCIPSLLSLLCKHVKRDALICNQKLLVGLFLEKPFVQSSEISGTFHSVMSSDLPVGLDLDSSVMAPSNFAANRWKSEAKRMPGTFLTTEHSHGYKVCRLVTCVIYEVYELKMF